MDGFQMERTRRKIGEALVQVRKVLDQSRDPQAAADVAHEYGDKYLLAEVLTGAASASLLSSLELLGLDAAGLAQVVEWAKERTVTLVLEATETCEFETSKKRETESATKHVTEVSRVVGGKTTYTDKVVTVVTEYFWRFGVRYEVSAYAGVRGGDRVVLCGREGGARLVTLSEQAPHPKTSVKPAVECDATWLLRRVAGPGAVRFEIDRSHAKCHTPSRNKDVADALESCAGVRLWAEAVGQYFAQHLFCVEGAGAGGSHDPGKLDLSGVHATGVFDPIVPLLEARDDGCPGEAIELGKGEAQPQAQAHQGAFTLHTGAAYETAKATTAVLRPADMAALLTAERASLEERLERNVQLLGRGTGLVTAAEARVVVLAGHLAAVAVSHEEGIDFVEGMLREQVVKAVGKEVTSADFAEYMRFHYRKVLRAEYQPQGLCRAVRRVGHDPEGTVSVEEQQPGSSVVAPVLALTRAVPAPPGGFRFALNASAEVRFGGTGQGQGQAHVHSYLGHRFSIEPLPDLHLQARARQFSGFVMLLGTVGGRDLFLPKHAMLVRDKDDFRIPLELDEIPTAKEFRDAIESLSPEQRRFAQAYRSMQLEATLFAVCVVQVKPQLERVLNLPQGSLTKEIKLTQDLLDLFVTYQIPSDLLSYQNDDAPVLVGADGADGDGVPVCDKVAQVREHVKAMADMIQKSKEAELEEARLKYEMEKARLQAEAEEAARVEAQAQARRRSRRSTGGGGGGGGMMKMKKKSRSMDRCAMQLEDRMEMIMDECGSAMPEVEAAGCDVNERGNDNNGDIPDTDPNDNTAQNEGNDNDNSKDKDTGRESAGSSGVSEDISRLPQVIEARFDAFDSASTVRPTIVKAGPRWTKRSQQGLLRPPTQSDVCATEQKHEKDKAFDLLDSLTRSGVLPLESAELHVFVAATHCFDKTLLETVVQDNVNPIEHVERSALIMASALHGVDPAALVKPDQAQRLREFAPQLFIQ